MFNNFEKFSCLKRAKLGSAQSFIGGIVRPQAQESAGEEGSLSLWGLFGSITLYILYAVYKDLSVPWPKAEQIVASHQSTHVDINNVTPQAEEMGLNDTLAPGSTQEQNVYFDDAHPGYMTEVRSSFDVVRNKPMNVDATLDNFFSRPLLIASQDWGVNAPFFQRINPWQLFFENPRVINRIANYRLLQAKLHIKVVINGNAFHYGRAIVSYNPLDALDQMTIDRSFISADLVAATQRPHIFLDPTNSQGGEMLLPFFTPDNVLDIPTMGWRKMGVLDIHSMQTLKHANGATDTVTVSVFAWATEVKMSVPTLIEPGAILPQAADEYGNKPVSRIAGAVANFASYLVDAPYVGPFALATKIGANAIGTIATLFGYSAPVNLEFQHNRLLPITNYSVVNMPSDCMKLTVDAKQELTIDPTIAGLDSTDELTINSIVKHQSWLDAFEWPLGAQREAILWNSVVDPCLHAQTLDGELHFPATCYATMPFRYWRGTLKFRFQVVCSKYHKGRLKIVYDPVTDSETAEYNTAYTTIVDISDTTDFTVDIGWGQIDPYREHIKPALAPNQQFGAFPIISYNSGIQKHGNGVISVYVVNELTVPNTTIDNDISINVFLSACEDFEVAVPDATYIQNLRLTSPSALIVPQSSEVEPQALEMSEETMKTDSAPVLTETLNTMSNMIGTSSDPTNLVYFGESIKSFRQLLKRFTRWKLQPGDGFSGFVDTRDEMGAFPFYPGYYSGSPIARYSFATPSGTYAPAWFTFLHYVTCAYGGRRGSIRWLFDATELNVDNRVRYTVTRQQNPEHWNYTGRSRAANVWTLPEISGTMNQTFEETTMNGAMLAYGNMNSILQWEVPYQKNKRFIPGKLRIYPTPNDNDWDEAFQIARHGVQQVQNRAFGEYHIAAGEDYTCFFYLGPPIFYVETFVPDGT
jgi:hypothetical protein